MPKTYCYLPQKTIDEIEKIQVDNNYSSMSQVLKELVDIGLKSYSSKNIIPTNTKSDKEADLSMKHTTYMLRMIAITSDVLRCVFDQSKVDGAHNNAEEQLAFIKNKVDHYIDGYLND